MAAPTNTETTLTSKGLREDLSNIIYRVAAEDTPFVSNIGRAKAKAIRHEWQTESLRSPSGTNAALEGDDVGTLVAPNRTTRVSNLCQILTESGGVSGTMEAVDKAGRVNREALLRLRKLQIDDPTWKRAMEALTESERVEGSKTYMRFQIRKAVDQDWETISIDLAAVSAPAPAAIAAE